MSINVLNHQRWCKCHHRTLHYSQTRNINNTLKGNTCDLPTKKTYPRHANANLAAHCIFVGALGFVKILFCFTQSHFRFAISILCLQQLLMDIVYNEPHLGFGWHPFALDDFNCVWIRKKVRSARTYQKKKTPRGPYGVVAVGVRLCTTPSETIKHALRINPRLITWFI